MGATCKRIKSVHIWWHVRTNQTSEYKGHMVTRLGWRIRSPPAKSFCILNLFEKSTRSHMWSVMLDHINLTAYCRGDSSVPLRKLLAREILYLRENNQYLHSIRIPHCIWIPSDSVASILILSEL